MRFGIFFVRVVKKKKKTEKKAIQEKYSIREEKLNKSCKLKTKIYQQT